MHVVMADILIADVIEFTLPESALLLGKTHASLDENLKAVFESIGLQLIEYGGCVRMPIHSTRIKDGVEYRERSIRMQVAGEAWLKRI